MKITKIGTGLLFAAGCLLAPAGQASLLTIEVGGATITDNGVGDLDPTLNQVTVSGPSGDVETQVTVGVSNTPGDNGTGSLLSLTSLSINNAGGSDATLRIRLTDTDFALPASGTLLESTLSATFVNDAAANSISVTSYADDSNIAFGTASSSSGLNLGVSGSVDSFAAVSLSGPYSLTSVIDISLAGGSVLTATANTVVIPEPASILLVFSGMGLVLGRRQSRKG